VSPILIRPVREQLEHDRVIRLLLGKWRKKYEAAANPGDERNTPLKIKGATFFPDLILAIPEGVKKSQAVVEVETSESLNHLEALAQWTNFSKAKGYFYLYVPAAGVDVAKRLAEQHHVSISELWSYYQIGEQVRFLQVFKGKGTPDLSMVDEEEPFRPVRPEPEPAEPVEAPPSKATPVRAGAAKTAERVPVGKGVVAKAALAKVSGEVPTAKAPAAKAVAKAAVAPPMKKVAAKPAAPTSSAEARGISSAKKSKPATTTAKAAKSGPARTTKPAASARKATAPARKAAARTPQRPSKPARAHVAKAAGGRTASSKAPPKKAAAKSKSSRSRR
jgi:hypothetical protein